MNLHKVKGFRCYQAVQIIGHGMVNYYASEAQDRLSHSHDAFFIPELATIALKKKTCGSEIFIPLTNVQNFELCEQVMKKSKEVKAPAPDVSEPVGSDAVESTEPTETATPAKGVKKVAKKATVKKATAKKAKA